MSQAPPGWYPDPGAPPGATPLLRWWDGGRWTEHLQHQPQSVGRAPGPTTDDGQPLAGWWWRALAWLIDSAAVGIVTSIVTLPAQIAVQRELMDSQAELERRMEAGEPVDPFRAITDMLDAYAEHLLWLLVVPALLTLVYHAVMLRWRGATLGKLAVGLRVRPAAADGRLSWAMIAVRLGVQLVLPWLGYLVAFASGSVAVFSLSILAISAYTLLDVLWATRRNRQAVHDVAARTVVVKLR